MPNKPKIDNPVAPGVAKQIDENLRRIYAEKLAEEIPTLFQELLRRLRERDVLP